MGAARTSAGRRGPAASVSCGAMVRRAVLVAIVVASTGCTLRQAGQVPVPPVRLGLFGQDFSAASRAVIAEQASVIVNHGFSWNVMEPQPGVWNFGPADAVSDFAEAHDLEHIGVHFAWEQDILDDMPAWVGAITDPDDLRAAFTRRAEKIFERYPGLDRIDVINEPLAVFGDTVHTNHFASVLGPDYIEQLFAIVRTAAPEGVELFVNENFVEYLPAKADALVGLVDDLTRAGVTIDGVGLQSHFILGEPDFDLLAATGSRLESLGVKVFITELDVPVAADVPDRAVVQAERYRRAVETCLSWTTCDVVNVWGVDDGHTWLDGLIGPGSDPLLFDREYRPKLAFYSVWKALLEGRPAAA